MLVIDGTTITQKAHAVLTMPLLRLTDPVTPTQAAQISNYFTITCQNIAIYGHYLTSIWPLLDVLPLLADKWAYPASNDDDLLANLNNTC